MAMCGMCRGADSDDHSSAFRATNAATLDRCLLLAAPPLHHNRAGSEAI